jgi:hypothetical protein
MDENADRTLRGQQVGQLINDTSERIRRRTFGSDIVGHTKDLRL